MKMSNTVLNASFVNISSVEHKEGPQFSLGYPCGSAGKEYSCNVGDLGLFPGLGGCPGDGKGYPLQYSGLENCMDCKIIVNGNLLYDSGNSNEVL